MTNTEAVAAAILFTGYSQQALIKAMLDAGVDGTGTYSAASKGAIDLIAVEVLRGMLGVTSISEGGYSISYNYNGIMERINFLNGETGEAPQPKVAAVHMW